MSAVARGLGADSLSFRPTVIGKTMRLYRREAVPLKLEKLFSDVETSSRKRGQASTLYDARPRVPSAQRNCAHRRLSALDFCPFSATYSSRLPKASSSNSHVDEYFIPSSRRAVEVDGGRRSRSPSSSSIRDVTSRLH